MEYIHWTDEDQERFKEVLAGLSPEHRTVVEKRLAIFERTAIRVAIPGIMARNFSHGIGSYLKP